MNKQIMQARLILLSDRIDELTHSNDVFLSRKALKDQLDRSSTSAACHYGEAIASESIKDFIHKLSVVEKELRETWALLSRLAIRLIPKEEINPLLIETDELIRIIYSSKRTATSTIRRGKTIEKEQ